MRASRMMAVAFIVLVVGAVLGGPVAAAPTQQESGGHLARLVTFVPAPTTPQELVNLWVNYSDPGAVKRLHGYSYTNIDETPPFVRNDATDLTPEQLRARQWGWDLRTMYLPSAAGAGYAPRWREVFGYDQLSFERSLGTGQPPTDYGVLEFATGTASVQEKLLAHQYEQEPAPHGFNGTLFRKYADNEQSFDDPTTRMTLGGLNRVVLGPELLVAGRTTDLVSNALAAHTGAAPSAMSVPAIAQVVRAVEDPNLLPGTALISASVFGLSWAPIGANPVDTMVQAQSPEEARRAIEAEMQAENEKPLLPPYVLFAMAYHRTENQADRFQTFTLLYPDEAVAQAAGVALTARIAAYRSMRDGKPMLGEDVVEQLEPVVSAGDSGATVTVRLRLAPDQPNQFGRRLYNRDLGFLAPGGS